MGRASKSPFCSLRLRGVGGGDMLSRFSLEPSREQDNHSDGRSRYFYLHPFPGFYGNHGSRDEKGAGEEEAEEEEKEEEEEEEVVPTHCTTHLGLDVKVVKQFPKIRLQ